MRGASVWGKSTSPYHEGERALHERYGRLDEQTAMGHRIHRPTMDVEHQQFLASLEYVTVGSIDADGRPWASMLFGEPGFAHAIDESTVAIAASPLPGDPLSENMVPGSPMSLVAIDLSTRRRIRANLTYIEAADPGLRLHVDQSYGNCPKYIQTRAFERPEESSAGADTAVVESFASLPARAAEIIRAADTFFVASHNNLDDQHDVGGVDVNHRGGRPGFVKVDGNTLTIPDYSGNFAFNTLGNFMVNPVAGLLFVDFDSGDMLQLTGRTAILWEDDDAIAAFQGARRAWTFAVDDGVLIRGRSSGRWTFGEFSPNALRTGTWAETVGLG